MRLELYSCQMEIRENQGRAFFPYQGNPEALGFGIALATAINFNEGMGEKTKPAGRQVEILDFHLAGVYCLEPSPPAGRAGMKAFVP